MTYTQPVGLGRIVLYTPLDNDIDSRHNGAAEVVGVIVRTWEDTSYENNEVNIRTLVDGPHHVGWFTSVPYSEEPKPGTWRWPQKK